MAKAKEEGGREADIGVLCYLCNACGANLYTQSASSFEMRLDPVIAIEVQSITYRLVAASCLVLPGKAQFLYSCNYQVKVVFTGAPPAPPAVARSLCSRQDLLALAHLNGAKRAS
ncbi:hypothetical protein ACLKA7_014875 [Drosophila subpalustris]